MQTRSTAKVFVTVVSFRGDDNNTYDLRAYSLDTPGAKGRKTLWFDVMEVRDIVHSRLTRADIQKKVSRNICKVLSLPGFSMAQNDKSGFRYLLQAQDLPLIFPFRLRASQFIAVEQLVPKKAAGWVAALPADTEFRIWDGQNKKAIKVNAPAENKKTETVQEENKTDSGVATSPAPTPTPAPVTVSIKKMQLEGSKELVQFLRALFEQVGMDAAKRIESVNISLTFAD